MNTGSYILIMEIKDLSCNIQIGSLKINYFEKGYYIYVGSAMGKGSTSLENRILRHLRSDLFSMNQRRKPKNHWHIDYFLNDKHVEIVKIIFVPSQIKEECELSKTIKKYADDLITRFGCSDCKCNSHLYYFKENNKYIDNILN